MQSDKKKEPSKKSPYIEFEPDKVYFSQSNQSNPFQAQLTIRNKSTVHIAIKVKTNAPASYIVKPNTCILAPTNKLELKIVSQSALAIVLLDILLTVRMILVLRNTNSSLSRLNVLQAMILLRNFGKIREMTSIAIDSQFHLREW